MSLSLDQVSGASPSSARIELAPGEAEQTAANS
jgi:hypothetical protein